MFYYFIRALISPFFKRLFSLKIYGALNVPKTGKAILAANHIAAADSIVEPISISRKINYIGKQEYFTGRGLKGKIIKYFMKSIGVIPVDRTGGEKSSDALNTAIRILQENRVFGIYPEGTRSPDGVLYKGHTGVARLAYITGAPIIPVGIIGTNIAQPNEKLLPKKSPVTIKFGSAILVKQKSNPTYQELRDLTEKVMTEIAQLTGQKVNNKIYGIQRKKELKNNKNLK
ncbi:MAG: 1-acyl-sn-glycerol-3-phosphate acyltransferase [Bifidobacteriaceae bacterium]|jgi:1-acyl-sn-glycerol-3-phosphate acyltransferase|nr:1-acyl-sn-glycerol-3-phosphate acyltransferase [Bifidobacteriaceae bacterium]